MKIIFNSLKKSKVKGSGNMLISPSILSVFSKNFEKKMEELEEVKPDLLHIDVMDNKFVPNYTFDHNFVSDLRNKTNLIFDTHLMIEEPEKYYIDYIHAGSEYLTFHFEASKDPGKLIDLIKKENVKAGISIKPNTSVEKIIPYLDKLDLVLVMSVEPGFGGQAFIPSALDKIQALSKIKKEKNLSFLIEVDGGVNLDNAKLIKEAGCDSIVVGSYLMNSDSIKDTYLKLKNV